MISSDYQILLYYKFVPLDDPAAIVAEQEDFCRSHSLKGRILVAGEGVNGTVSGLKADTEAYMQFMQNHTLFSGIEFKADPAEGHAFHKLHVRVKNEIVNLSAGEELRPWEETAPYIEPEEMRRILAEEPDDVVIVDTRSDYEFKVGKFKNAITLDIQNFRDINEKLAELEQYKDKKIITYCTGGIRCEKFTPLMLKAGFKDVYQLHGGIIRYGHEAGGENFEGACYVFDERVVAPVNSINPTVIGECELCAAPTERMINCANANCNKHFLICDHCAEKMQGTCSAECNESPARRAWDGTGQYLRGVNSKNYAVSCGS